MKKIILGIFCLLSVVAKADTEGTGALFCAASGDVVIQISDRSNNASGYIGSTKIRLSQNGNILQGNIEGLDVSIGLDANSHIASGFIGDNSVLWHFNPYIGMITGSERCIVQKIVPWYTGK